MITVGRFHEAADLAIFQSAGSVFKFTDHFAGGENIAVRVGGQAGVFAVLVHQSIEVGGQVAAFLKLLENIFCSCLFLSDHVVGQRLAGGHIHGQQQNVLGRQNVIFLNIGFDVLIGGTVGKHAIQNLLIVVGGTVDGKIGVPVKTQHTQRFVELLFATHGNDGFGCIGLKLGDLIGRQIIAQLFGLFGNQGVHQGGVQGVGHQVFTQTAFFAPVQCHSVIGVHIRLHFGNAVGQPVQIHAGRDRLAVDGHQLEVTGDIGGGKEEVLHGGIGLKVGRQDALGGGLGAFCRGGILCRGRRIFGTLAGAGGQRQNHGKNECKCGQFGSQIHK